MSKPKREVIDRDMGVDEKAKRDLLNAMIRAQSMIAADQVHTAFAILETEIRKIRATLNSKIK